MSDTLPAPLSDEPAPPQADAVRTALAAATPSSASFQPPESCPPLFVTEFFPENLRTENSPRRKPGPGLPEALGWTFGVFAAHLAASLGLIVLIVALMMLSGGNPNQLAAVDEFGTPYLTLLLGGDQMLVLLASVVAVSLRFSGRVSRVLNLTSPHPLHVLAVAGLVLPLASVSGEVYRVTAIGWGQLGEFWPVLKLLDEANTVEYLQEIANVLPLPVLLLFVAVAPALAEELVFRGVIGRGLVARWGVVAGVLMTSVLFAAVHMHPVHVVAVVPLGIAMHLIYLATKSFWAPVLLHFLNNAWASVATHMAGSGEIDAAAVEAPLSPTLWLASLTAIIVLGGLLYRTRLRYVQDDGREWSPGYVSVEQPPAEISTTRDYGLCSRRTLVTAGSAWAAFAVAFVAELVAFAR